MIVNLLKILFFYFLYRFIKVMVKGYLKKKFNEASEKIREQMEVNSNQYTHHGDLGKDKNDASRTNQQAKHGAPKTFDAEYKVIKDD